MERRSFLLDTGLLLGMIKDAPWARQARSDNHFDDPQTLVTTSVVCHGEIMAISERRQWGNKKRADLAQLLRETPAIGINHEPILNAYARIDAWSRGREIANQPASPPKPARPMSQNDMWIAATAYAIGAVLVSTDRDFEHLQEAWINFVYIDQRAPSRQTSLA